MPRPSPKCGTYNGYAKHKRNKEEACDPCKEARRLDSQKRVEIARAQKRVRTKYCEYCGQSFMVPFYGKGHGRRFCDQTCITASLKDRRGMATCKYCGIEFEPYSVKGVKAACCSDEHSRLYRQEYRRRNQEKNNLRLRCKSKGITVEQLYFMRKLQSDCCCICGSPETAVGNCGPNNSQVAVKNLGIDHCHETGQFRGLLCTRCNTALGMLKDNILIVEHLLAYIHYHEMRLKHGSTYRAGSGRLINVEAAFAAHAAGADPIELQHDPTIIRYL